MKLFKISISHLNFFFPIRKGKLFLFRYKSLILISILGIALRLYGLGVKNLWFDEALGWAHFTQNEFSPNFDPQPPFYFFLLKLFTILLGEGEFGLRFPSALAGVISLILFYKISRRLTDEGTAQISVLFLAVSPFHLWYSQEARAFAISLLLALCLIYILLLVLEKDRFIYWIGIYFFLTLGYYTSYWIFLFLPALTFIFFVKYRWLFGKWILSLLLSLLSFLPWLPRLFRQLSFLQRGFWIPAVSLRNILITFENFNLGYNANLFIYRISWIFFGGLFLLGVIALFKKKDVLLFLSSLVFLPVGLLFLLSQKLPIYLDRNLIIILPFYYLILAVGWQRQNANLKFLSGSAILILITISIVFYYKNYLPSPLAHHFGVHPKKSFKPVVDFVLAQEREGDIIGFTNFDTPVLFYYYAKRFYSVQKDKAIERWFHFIATDGYDEYFSTLLHRVKGPLTRIFLPQGFNKEIKARRIWMVYTSWERGPNLGSNAAKVKELMDENCKLISERWLEGVIVSLYQHKPN